MHNMDTIIGAAWLRSVDKVIDGLEGKRKRECIKQIDHSFADAMEKFWDSAIQNKIDQKEMYKFAFSFFVGYYERLLDI
jgi:hypothetical protein